MQGIGLDKKKIEQQKWKKYDQIQQRLSTRMEEIKTEKKIEHYKWKT